MIITNSKASLKGVSLADLINNIKLQQLSLIIDFSVDGAAVFCVLCRFKA